MNSVSPPVTTYVVTLSAVHRLQMLRFSSLSIPELDCPEFSTFNRRFVDVMRRVVAPAVICPIDMYDLADTIGERIMDLLAEDPTKVVLHICIDIGSSLPGARLNVNRLYDDNGVCIGHGPRPGYPLIDEQLLRMESYLKGKSIILVENGVFSGNTLQYVLDKLQLFDYRVSNIIIGFCKLSSAEALKKGLNGRLEIIRKIEVMDDWLPDCDIVTLCPNSGRVVGHLTKSGPVPIMCDSISFSYPYVMPFGMTGNWVGLPEAAAREVSVFGLEATIELFECIQRHNSRLIRIKDLVENSYVSVPLRIGTLEDITGLEFNMPVLNYLRSVQRRYRELYT